MDDIDRAQEREQFDRDNAIRAIRQRLATAPNNDGRCIECGDEIEPRRLAAIGPSCRLCYPCALNREDHRP